MASLLGALSNLPARALGTQSLRSASRAAGLRGDGTRREARLRAPSAVSTTAATAAGSSTTSAAKARFVVCVIEGRRVGVSGTSAPPPVPVYLEPASLAPAPLAYQKPYQSVSRSADLYRWRSPRAEGQDGSCARAASWSTNSLYTRSGSDSSGSSGATAAGDQVEKTSWSGARRQRCRHQKGSAVLLCAGCTQEDCGTCEACVDMAKFGGPSVLRRACINRPCSRMVHNNEVTNCMLFSSLQCVTEYLTIIMSLMIFL